MANGKKRPRMSKTEMAMRSPVWMASKRSPMAESAQAKLGLEARMAFHRITQGECADDDPDELALTSNVALILCEWGYGGEYLQGVKDAQDALLAAQLRANSGAVFNFDSAGRHAVQVLLELYEQQLAICDHAVIMKAMATAADRIRSGDVVAIGWDAPSR